MKTETEAGQAGESLTWRDEEALSPRAAGRSVALPTPRFWISRAVENQFLLSHEVCDYLL